MYHKFRFQTKKENYFLWGKSKNTFRSTIIEYFSIIALRKLTRIFQGGN